VLKVNVRPYVDELQEEIVKILKETRPGKTEIEMQAGMGRLHTLISKQSKRLAAELGLAGDYMLLFMLTSGMISLAWSAFYLRRILLDDRKPFDQRLELIELQNSLGEAISALLASATSYAELYSEKQVARTA
jgi:hypothetical protein